MGTDALEVMNEGSQPTRGFRDEAGPARQAWLDVGDIRPGRIYTPDAAAPAVHGRARLGDRLRLAAMWNSFRRAEGK